MSADISGVPKWQFSERTALASIHVKVDVDLCQFCTG